MPPANDLGEEIQEQPLLPFAGPFMLEASATLAAGLLLCF